MERTRRVITDNSENNLDKVLIKTFTHKYRAGYVEVGGTVISDLFLGIEKDIEDFEVFNDDIWLLSFPKSGTTWTSEMVWLLANNLDYETAAKEFLPLRFPAIEAQMMYDWKEMQMDFQQYEHPFRSIRYCANLARPRLIKSHLPWPLLPRQIRTGEKTPRIIYVSRDPRDVIVSYFHYSRIMDNFSGSFDDFFNLFIGDKLYPTPYWKHVLELWNRRSQPNVLFLKYEDMLKSISQVAAETASFLERKYTDDDIARVAGHLAFENMKDNQSVNLKWALKLFNSFGLGSGQGDFMRKGTVGDHVTLFTDAHRDVVRKWSEELLAGSDYSYNSQ